MNGCCRRLPGLDGGTGCPGMWANKTVPDSCLNEKTSGPDTFHKVNLVASET